MQVEIMKKSELYFVGIKVAGAFPELGKKVRKSVAKLKNIQSSVQNLKNKNIFCVCPPEIITSNDDIHTIFISYQVTSEENVAENLELVTIPVQEYAIIRFEGPLWKYGDFLNQIPHITKEKGYECAPRDQSFGFEEYPHDSYDWDNDNAESQTIISHNPVVRSAIN